MIKIGTDICSIERVTATYQRFGRRFLERIFNEAEIIYILSHPPHTNSRIAARFAAKEACLKALGTGLRNISWKEMEITRQPSGEPQLKLTGRALERAQKRGLDHFEVSLSHERDFAVAFVIGYSSGTQLS